MRYSDRMNGWVALLLALPAVQGVGTGPLSNETSTQGQLSWYNWEGTVVCYPDQIVTPSSIKEVQSLVKKNPKVRAIGLGHSFNRAVCANGGLMLDMSGMNQALELNTVDKYVRTQPGISTRGLLAWLRERGWSLPTYSYYIDQTIAGAVATGTHGSSTAFGTISNLLVSLTIVTANGKVKEFTPDDGEEWEAAMVSVGLMGVIVELKLAVVPDRMVWKVVNLVSGSQVQADVDRFVADPMSVDGYNTLYSIFLGAGIRTYPKDDVERGDNVKTPLSLGPFTVHPGKVPLSDVYLTQPRELTELLRNVFGHYDQYEFMIEKDLASGCFQALRDMATSQPYLLMRAFIPILIRFVKAEDAMLSATNGGARMYMNMDDYDSYRTPGNTPSPCFTKIKELMASDVCKARIHFGKASVHSLVSGDWGPEDPPYARSAWGPMYERFKMCAHEWDPQGKFRDGEGFLE